MAQSRLIVAHAPHHHGKKLLAGLQLKLEDGWFTYWRTPGESGAPPEFDWSDSVNVEDVKVLWPRPQQVKVNDYTINGYPSGVVLPLVITPQDPEEPMVLHVKVTYAVCRDVCVPVTAEHVLDLEAIESAAEKAREQAREAAREAREQAREQARVAREQAAEARRQAEEESREQARIAREQAADARRQAEEDAREQERQAREQAREQIAQAQEQIQQAQEQAQQAREEAQENAQAARADAQAQAEEIRARIQDAIDLAREKAEEFLAEAKDRAEEERDESPAAQALEEKAVRLAEAAEAHAKVIEQKANELAEMHAKVIEQNQEGLAKVAEEQAKLLEEQAKDLAEAAEKLAAAYSDLIEHYIDMVPDNSGVENIANVIGEVAEKGGRRAVEIKIVSESPVNGKPQVFVEAGDKIVFGTVEAKVSEDGRTIFVIAPVSRAKGAVDGRWVTVTIVNGDTAIEKRLKIVPRNVVTLPWAAPTAPVPPVPGQPPEPPRPPIAALPE